MGNSRDNLRSNTSGTLGGGSRAAGGGESANAGASPQSHLISPPAISIPKGGGAIRGIGEKFAANPVTGTGSMAVPIATSPGRSGFGPQLSLSYDSGSGNGPFGFGWTLSLPAIARKTDKGLPRYLDAEESDVFILSGAEDLVPVLGQDGTRFVDDTTVPGYTIHRYRPRIEGLFARIERWTNRDTGEVHWRSISRDNITTLYGKDNNSRIFDPTDSEREHPRRIFSWLICASYDDKGNAIVYEYKEENSDGVEVSQAHESNRDALIRSANRYLKRIRYGNRAPNRSPEWKPTDPALLPVEDWMFEVVFDYGEHDPNNPSPEEAGQWLCRYDPFSSYRAGFEVRTYRLCQRVLMFHHFPEDEPAVGRDCLVRSTDFAYRDIRNKPEDEKQGHPIASFIASITQSGYRRQEGGGYLRRSLPPLAFEYSQAEIVEEIREVDAESLENLPQGLDGSAYRWVDLDGEGLSGILTEQASAWLYKPNLGDAHLGPPDGRARFGAQRIVARQPSLAALNGGQQQLLDLAGDGQLDLVELAEPTPGFYERTRDRRWETFRPFTSHPNTDWNDPNLRFVDLTGDGHADILVTEDRVLTWYPSLAEAGYGPAERVRKALDEEKGPRLVFADGSESIYLADLSGDGLTDLARIRNGEVCYWPNLGYGRFGAKVTMDRAPRFDAPDQFSQRRIRLADIDGSGTTDILYLGGKGIDIYRNQAGNSWSAAERLGSLPAVDSLSSVMALDLLGNGTACLVWSSPLPADARRPMRYIDLMGGRKPHLLVSVKNNLGAETRVHYAPSTRFYLQDKTAGKPWITRLPFPVHVVERVKTYDRISGSRFVSRYAYHHGYFDGVEREFRGFGMVEQWDTEEIGAIHPDDSDSSATNLDEASFVPPVWTKTWFHTGAHIDRRHLSNFFAGIGKAMGEYYREPTEPGFTEEQADAKAKALLLDDTLLPEGLSPELTPEEEREACRALKGSILRQEVYALDDHPQRSAHPYSVSERNYTLERLQPEAGNRHAVFFAHPCETLDYHYERNPADPRISHTLTLEVDRYGNVLKSLAVGYGRRAGNSPLSGADKEKQERPLITYTETDVTNAIDLPDDYRTPLPCEVRTYELTGYRPGEGGERFAFADWTEDDFFAITDAEEIPYEQTHDVAKQQKRLIERVRTLYRPDDLGVSLGDPLALLPLGAIQSMALPGETYKLAFTPGLLTQVYRRPREDQPDEELLPDPADVLPADPAAGQIADRGGYVDLEGTGHWWIPSGRVFHSPDASHTAAQELAAARQDFFLPRRFQDPFGQPASIRYDEARLLVEETTDVLDNRVRSENDYRVLQPRLITDPNGNRSAAAFDALGMVVGTAVMGKTTEGDDLASLEPDPTDLQIREFLTDPRASAADLLGSATTRIIYDLHRYADAGQPTYAATLARETHVSDLDEGQQTKIQISFTYSDGFGREVQTKVQAEPGAAPEREPNAADPALPGKLILDPATGKPVQAFTSSRWVGAGRTLYNNKGKPIKQYEPFFSSTHLVEEEPEMVQTGVTPILFYDPLGRVVATLHPSHTYEKAQFDPWRQTSYDVNDTVVASGEQTGDPRTDPDISGYVRGYFESQPADWETWYAQRHGGALGTQEQAAANKAAGHTDTPTSVYFDTLGRPFLTVAHNRVVCPDHDLDGTEDKFHTRVELDIEGNQRLVRDAIKQNGDAQGRIVMRYDYDMLGNRLHQASMEAGERWMLTNVAGNPIRAWDSRNHDFRTAYDRLRRPIESYMSEGGPPALVERTIYGETQPDPETNNLRGQVAQVFDQAGVVTSDDYDFKGNLLRSRRRLAQEYKTTLDWSGAVPLESETYTSHTLYDAVNRPIQTIAPHSDQPDAKRNVIQPGYNEANLLERIDVWLDYPEEATVLLNADTDPPSSVGVSNVDYDAKGQRLRIDYKNGATTHYAYDPETFRLTHLYTRRGATFTEDCGKEPPPPRFAAPEVPPPNTPCGLQNLHYTYDPAGNITHIRDDAQQTIYFRNQCVQPTADYTYDALYRLIEARGREHLGQAGGAPIPHSYNDAPRVGLLHPGDCDAMGTYIERYVYDAVGNFLEMQHRGFDPAHNGWTRSYQYAETSLIEDGTSGTLLKTSNRLSRTSINASGAPPIQEVYAYDSHGNMKQMPQLQTMQWDYRDQLHLTQRQKVNDDDEEGIERHGERTYYVYDAAGERVRKVTELENGGGLKDERVYLGGLEIYHQYSGSHAGLVRETLHIMDDEQRIALVETRTQGNDPAPAQLIRYQFGNHLGSASLELDDEAQIISYEEYTPYGSTSYRALRSLTETPKRYRYTGKERDEESGLNYHGARYYAGWLGRWTNTDQGGFVDGTNLYDYVLNNPVVRFDPTGTDAQPSVSSGYDKAMKALLRGVKSTPANSPRSLSNPLLSRWLQWRGGPFAEGIIGTTYVVAAAAAAGAIAETARLSMMRRANIVRTANLQTGEPGNPWHFTQDDFYPTMRLARQIRNQRPPNALDPTPTAEPESATKPQIDVIPIPKPDSDKKRRRQNSCLHHIAPEANAKWTNKHLVQIFAYADLNISTSIYNLVLLPASMHKGPHPVEYDELVLSALQYATENLKPYTPEYRSAVIDELANLRRIIQHPLSYLAWLVRNPAIIPTPSDEWRKQTPTVQDKELMDIGDPHYYGIERYIDRYLPKCTRCE